VGLPTMPFRSGSRKSQQTAKGIVSLNPTRPEQLKKTHLATITCQNLPIRVMSRQPRVSLERNMKGTDELKNMVH
jgi:hypothetical protein